MRNEAKKCCVFNETIRRPTKRARITTHTVLPRACWTPEWICIEFVRHGCTAKQGANNFSAPPPLARSSRNGQTVCYKCISDWWSYRSARLGVTDRVRIEGRLASWLRKYHRAEVLKETPGSASDATNADFQMVARCAECAGSGKLMEGERCRFCNGFGTVRIVVPK